MADIDHQLADVIQLAPYIKDWPAGVYPGDSDRPGIARPMDNQAGVEELLRRVTAPPPLEFEDYASDVMFDLLATLVRKQGDYGPDSINRSPGGALNGINVRMHDKLSRAINLAHKPDVPQYESLLDTYRDLANYAVIAVMVLEGTWPTS